MLQNFYDVLLTHNAHGCIFLKFYYNIMKILNSFRFFLDKKVS